MRLTHRLALAATFVGAAAFAQSGTGTAADPNPATRTPPPATTSTSPSSTTPSATETGKSAAAMSPAGVLSMLHQVNQDEIKLGRAAQSKAQNDKVKDFAKDMIDDHTALDKKITEFVQKDGKGKVTLSSSQIPASKRQEMKTMGEEAEHKLSSATGATFDRSYMSEMVKGHEAVLADLEAALPALKSQDKVHDLVSDARDKVKDHRDHAKDILKDLDRSTATGGSGTQGTGGSSTGTHDTTSPRSTTTPGSTTTPNTSGGTGR
jgi:putative membrane protein